MDTSKQATPYGFIYHCHECDTDDPQSHELPSFGSLEDALEIAKIEGVTINLTDEPGFPRGVVYASGDYTLT